MWHPSNKIKIQNLAKGNKLVQNKRQAPGMNITKILFLPQIPLKFIIIQGAHKKNKTIRN